MKVPFRNLLTFNLTDDKYENFSILNWKTEDAIVVGLNSQVEGSEKTSYNSMGM